MKVLFGALVPKWPVTLKQLALEPNGLKFGDGGGGGTFDTYIWGTFDLSIVQGYFGVTRCTCLNMACNLKMANHRAKPVKFGTLRY